MNRFALVLIASALLAAGARAQAVDEIALPAGHTATSVAAANLTLVVGSVSAQAAYVYTRPAIGSPWTLRATIRPDDPSPACFGSAVAFNLGRAIVADACRYAGTPNDVPRGVAYIFRDDAGTWVQEARLADAGAVDFFGDVVGIDGTSAVAGSIDTYNDETGEGGYGGGVIYDLVGGTWTVAQTVGDAWFVDIDGGVAAIGGGRGGGHTVVYERTDSGWTGTDVEPVSGAQRSRGELGLWSDRLLRIGADGIRFFGRAETGWRRMGLLQRSAGSARLDVRGRFAAVASSAGLVLYRAADDTFGWAGPVAVASIPTCVPTVAPTFVACPMGAVVRLYDTTALPAFHATPLPTAPSDGAATTVDVDVAWEPVPGAFSYVLEYARTPDFLVPEGTRSGLVEPSVRVTGLASGQTYYWHVRAETAATSSAWSRQRSFETQVGTPGEIVLYTPASQAVLVSPTTVEFTWRAATFATSYDFQLDTESEFSSPLVDWTEADLATTVGPPDVTFVPGERYYWRVRGRGEGGTGPWRSRFFTVASPPPPAPTAAPALVSPADGATGVDRRPTFVWRSVATGATYTIQVDQTPAFQAPVLQQTVADTSAAPSTPLGAVQAYYWRVRASNVGGAGPWSAPAAFATGATVAPEGESPEAEPTLAVVPNPGVAPRVVLTLAEASDAVVRVFDVQGRVVAVFDAPSAAGRHAFPVPPSLPSGRYVVRAEVRRAGVPDARVLTVPFVVAR